MQEIFDKLSVRTTDYIATIGVEDERLLSEMLGSVKGMVCVGDINKKRFKNLEDVKVVKSIEDLDRSAFDKVFTIYGNNFKVRDLINNSDTLTSSLEKANLQNWKLFSQTPTSQKPPCS